MKIDIPLRQRIGLRISLIIAVIMLIGVGLVEVIILRNEARHRERYEQMQLAEIEGELRHKARFAATVLAAGGAEALLTYNYTVLDNYARSLAEDPDVLEVIYRDANNRSVAGFSLGEAAKSHGVIAAQEPIHAGTYRAGSVIVLVGMKRPATTAASMEKVSAERFKDALTLFAMIALILTAGVMGGVMFSVNRMVVQPLNEVVRHMAAAPAETIMDPPEAHRNDEIGHLVQTYNALSLSVASYKRDLMMKVQELEASRADLNTLNETLEQRVAERTRALEESNEDIKTFAYIVSHDLRAPLVSIKGFSAELALSLKDLRGLLEEIDGISAPPDQGRIKALMDADVPEALKFMESSVERMDRLLTAVLTLSRAGRRELMPECIDMNVLTGSLLDSLAYQSESRTITVSELPKVEADRLAMEQIIGNLLDNAFKYLDPSRPGVIEISAEERPDEIIYHIKDNGRGISRDDLPKVFEMFRRVGMPGVPGDGMGLAFVKTLVKRHGGRIWCDSEPGRGSVFSVAMPKRGTRNV